MKLLIVILILCFNVSIYAQSNEDKILGIYTNSKKTAHIEIYKKDNEFMGKIKWIKENRKDDRNPIKELQDRELLGLVVIENLKYDSIDNYINGKVYDPDSGRTYKCKMWFENKNYKFLNIRGFIGISILGRSEILEKLE